MLYLLSRYHTVTEAIKEKANAPRRGGKLSIRQMATPAKATWEIPAPMKVIFLRTMNVPTREQTIPAVSVEIRVFTPNE